MNNTDKVLSLQNYVKHLKSIQAIQVEILSDFHLFCEENELTYVLAWGTLLGAIRHNGFIPWDDDIDICMPRDDYEKFLSIKNKLSEKYYVQNYIADHSFYPFTKIRKENTKMVMESASTATFHQGIWIDVFPLDQMPKKSKILHNLRYYRIANLIGIVTSSEISKVKSSKKTFNKLLRYIYYYLNKAFTPHYFVNKLEKSLKKDYKNYSELFDLTNASLGSVDDLFSIKEVDLRNRTLHDFEGYKFYVPNNSEYYLKKMYGNYLQLPPKEHQYPHHKVINLKY